MFLKTRPPLQSVAVGLALVIAFIIGAAACGDDGDTTGSPSETESPGVTSSPDGEQTSAPTEDGQNFTRTPTVTGEEGSALSLIQGWLDGVNGRIRYRYVSDFGGHPDGFYTMYYLDGSHRHDWLNEASGFGVTVVTIVDGQDAYTCNVSESTSFCRSTTEDLAVQSRIAILIVYRTLEGIVENFETMSVSELPDEEIAGVEANCFEVVSPDRITEGPPGDETLKFCFSSEGRLLLIDHTVSFDGTTLPDDHLLLEAQEVGEATPADFEPPAQLAGG